MPSRQERSDKTVREMFLEQAAAYFDDLKLTTESVPTQHAFDTAEAFCLAQGRELIRQSLEAILQEQIDDHEKKRDDALSAMPTEKTSSGLPNESGASPMESKERTQYSRTKLTLQSSRCHCLPFFSFEA